MALLLEHYEFIKTRLEIWTVIYKSKYKILQKTPLQTWETVTDIDRGNGTLVSMAWYNIYFLTNRCFLFQITWWGFMKLRIQVTHKNLHAPVSVFHSSVHTHEVGGSNTNAGEVWWWANKSQHSSTSQTFCKCV